MPLSLTCDCGARFDVEDALAGQTVGCPECQQPLKAPAAQRPILRTSGFALASFLLAVVGAFTVVGTIAAVILGIVAFALILRDRERVAGLGFASAGVGLGIVFTLLTLWAFSTGELFGGLRRIQIADQLESADPKAPLEVKETGFSITRPSTKWAKAKKDFSYLLVDPLLRRDAVLLLVQPDLNAYADVQVQAGGRIASFEEDVVNQLRQNAGQAAPVPNKDKANGKPNVRGGEDEEEPQVLRITDVAMTDRAVNLPTDGTGADQVQQQTVKLKLQGKSWTLVARAYQAKGARLYIVRAFAETAHFARVKDELTKILDSFKLTPAP